MYEQLIERCAALDGAALGEGAFSAGPAIWVGTREVAHLDANGGLDIRLTKAEIRARRPMLRADMRVALRASSSDWLEFRIGSDADLDDAVDLVRDAIAANVPSAPAGSPPIGVDLDRRRRFH